MTNLASLGIKIEARDIKKAVAELKRLEKQGKKTEKGARKLLNSYKGLNGAIAALGIGVLTKQLINQVSLYQSLTNKLRLVTDGTEQLAQVQEQLFQVAQNTRGSYEATIDLYSRFARSTEALGLSQADLLGITETVNQAVAISGSTAASSSAALFQLGQGLAAGALRGEELNSVMEQTPRLARAIADGVGVEIGALRKLASEGKLTAEVVTKALKDQASVLAAEFGETEKTISQAFQQIENSALKTFGSIEGGDLVDSMDEFRKIIDDPVIVDGLQSIATVMIDIASLAIKAASGLGMIAQALTSTEIEKVQEEIGRLKGRLVILAEDEIGNKFKEWFGDGVQADIDKTTEKLRVLHQKLIDLTFVEENTGDSSVAPKESKQGLTDDQIALIIERDSILAGLQIQAAIEHEIKLEEIKVDSDEQKLANLRAYLNEGFALEKSDAIRRQANELMFTQAKIGMLANVAAAAKNYLVSTGKENTRTGKIIFAASKAVAIAQSIIHTQVGVAAALKTPWMIPWIKATGYTATALIAATSVSGGGGAGGGGGSPPVGSQNFLDSQPQLPSDLSASDQQTGSLVINITGGLINEEFLYDELIPSIQDAVENRDTILIRNDSRNAIELLEA